MAALDLAGHVPSLQGPLQQPLSTMEQNVRPRLGVPAPQTVDVHFTLPRPARHQGPELSGSTQSSLRQAAWLEILPRWQEVSCVGGLCKSCCGPASGLQPL